MKALVIKLPDRLDARLTAVARRHKTAKSVVVREALERALRDRPRPSRGSALDLVRDLVGCVSGPGDLSVNKAHMKAYGR
jgi:hypothetical protein